MFTVQHKMVIRVWFWTWAERGSGSQSVRRSDHRIPPPRHSSGKSPADPREWRDRTHSSACRWRPRGAIWDCPAAERATRPAEEPLLRPRRDSHAAADPFSAWSVGLSPSGPLAAWWCKRLWSNSSVATASRSARISGSIALCLFHGWGQCVWPRARCHRWSRRRGWSWRQSGTGRALGPRAARFAWQPQKNWLYFPVWTLKQGETDRVCVWEQSSA